MGEVGSPRAPGGSGRGPSRQVCVPATDPTGRLTLGPRARHPCAARASSAAERSPHGRAGACSDAGQARGSGLRQPLPAKQEGGSRRRCGFPASPPLPSPPPRGLRSPLPRPRLPSTPRNPPFYTTRGRRRRCRHSTPARYRQQRRRHHGRRRRLQHHPALGAAKDAAAAAAAAAAAGPVT